MTGTGRYNYHHYEARRNLGLSRFYRALRLWVTLFCLLLLYFAYPYLAYPWQVLAGLSLAAVAYGIFRFFTKPRLLRNKPGSILFDCFDFLLIGGLIYLTGGVKSFFQIIFCIPILICTVRFGLRTGFFGLLFAAALTGANYLFAYDNLTFPVALYLVTGLGSLCFMIWTTTVLVRAELRLREELYASSVTDHLTGLFHSGYIRERVGEEIRRCRRLGGGFSIAFLDLDRFKKINDRCGHAVGDEVLKHIAGVLRSAARSGETLARYGGDEFLLLLPGAGREEAELALQRMRRAMHDDPYYIEGHPVRLGVSGGVAEFPRDGETLLELLLAADQKLYHQKG